MNIRNVFTLALSFVVALCASGSSCKGNPSDDIENLVPSWAESNVTEPGWNLFPTPRTFNPPGTLFRIDENGVMYVIATIGDLLLVEKGRVSTPSISSHTTRSLGFLASMLSDNKVFEEVANAEAKWDSKKDAKFGLTLSDPVFSESVIESPFPMPEGKMSLKDAIENYISTTGYTPIQNNSYYIMMATRASLSIDYKVSDDTVRAYGGKVEVKKIANLDGSRDVDGGSTLVLQKKWDEPYRVMYKADKISFSSGAAGVAKVEDISLAESIDWRSEED